MHGCTRSPDRVRIATGADVGHVLAADALHPVSGPGEDRNSRCDQLLTGASELHPVSGPGEDRNRSCSSVGAPVA